MVIWLMMKLQSCGGLLIKNELNRRHFFWAKQERERAREGRGKEKREPPPLLVRICLYSPV